MPTAQALPPFVLSEADRRSADFVTGVFSLQTNPPTASQLAILSSVKPYLDFLHQDQDLAPIYCKLAATFPLHSTPELSGRAGAHQSTHQSTQQSTHQSTRRSELSGRTRAVVENGFKAFLIILNTGINLPQLTGTLDIVEFFCRLSEDIQRLIVTQKDGTIVEFPFVLFARTSIQRRGKQQKLDAWKAREAIIAQLMPFDDQLTRPTHHLEPTEQDLQPDHVVFIDFTQRRLAFVFYNQSDAIRFHCYIIFLAKLSQRSYEDGAWCVNRCTSSTSPSSCVLLSGASGSSPMAATGIVSKANKLMPKSGEMMSKSGASRPSTKATAGGLVSRSSGGALRPPATLRPNVVSISKCDSLLRGNRMEKMVALDGVELDLSSLGQKGLVRRLSSSTRSSAVDAAAEVVLGALCHRKSENSIGGSSSSWRGRRRSGCSLLGDLASGTVIEFSSSRRRRERPA